MYILNLMILYLFIYLTQVTFYQELLVLVDMEDQDNLLISNLLNCKKEKQDLKEQSDKVVAELNALQAKQQDNEKKLNE